MELPQADLEMVHALQIFPRVSWAQLGPILDQHPTTLAARWERLHSEGKVWVTGHQGSIAASGTVAFVSIQCYPQARNEVLARMCAIPEVGNVEESTRSWDARLTVLTGDWAQLTGQILPLVREDPGIARLHVSVMTGLYATGSNWRLDVLSPAQQQRLRELNPVNAAPAGSPVPQQNQLRRLLSVDGRMPAAQIAAELGIHPSTAARHLRQLLDSRAVLLRCELAQNYSGHPVFCHWHARIPPTQLEAAVRQLRSMRTLRLCATITGDSNFTFALWLRNPGEIAEVERVLQQVAPGMQIIDSDVGVRTHKRMGWMLRADTTATGQVITHEAG
ncbi:MULTISPECIES: Lrp/AsnC family transcriptional regulator [Glutamicibacter]|uniref:Lrp/AsnC family transcriptional regulator n=1 Tax=Glutamicibacter halophytocola TaxID=1933880 RepID=A0AA94XW45_9MICC|nr:MULTISPECIES: Lrp/AsnC family transcriptional regulator [Glutamicibacter]MBF6670724.1 Lrp/AsnC family transcriptional regulator [Glutamicibacter sp. FBE19]UUX58478.1 Lrp/AsnC family transcriptional regulator [Glutamicibacter halophytocola]